MNDGRLDQLIRASLDWQAEQDARLAPSLETSARRVAERLGPQSTGLRSVVTLRRDPGGSLQLFLVVILLAALAAAIAVGSGLIRLPQPPPDLRPFGVGGMCSSTAPADGVVFRVQTADVPITLYEDGSLVTDRTSTGQTKLSAITGIEYAERRLSPAGIAMIRDRIAAAGVVEGCRSIRTRESTGSIIVPTTEGFGELYWNPQVGQYRFARFASSEEETAASDLAEALEHPEAWLPDDAWADLPGDRIAPTHWVVLVRLIPTDMHRGAGVGLPDGTLLDGSDPRYAGVILPDGQEPSTFGAPVPAALTGPHEGASYRCGMLDTEDAIRLAESLDSMALGTHDEGDLYTTDLSLAVFIGIRPSVPAGHDCESTIADLVRSGQWTEPPSPGPGLPAPELDGRDPCALVPPSVDVHLGGVTTRRPRPPELEIGLPGAACHLVRTRTMDFELRRAVVSFYKGVVDHDGASEIALSILGDLAAEESVRARPSWVNACLASSQPCAGAIAVWSDPYFIVIDFGRDAAGAYTDVTPDTARAIAGEIVEELRE
jgi:hypothetical protein